MYHEYKDNTEHNRDFFKGNPISVIAVYSPAGKIKPVYVGLTDLYGNVCKSKIDGVKYTKDGNGYTTYCCVYNNGHRQQQINLTFYIRQHLWVLEH